MEAKPTIVVSRCDRLGDLVLSLPVLGYLRDAGFDSRILHVSKYAADVGEWARFNGLCQRVWIENDPPPSEINHKAVGLALFHSPVCVAAFRRSGLIQTFGPRPKLSALFGYTKTLSQHRSRVLKSETRYNLDLAESFLEWRKVPAPEFRGLPKLKVPPVWLAASQKAADLVIVVSNSGSASNWPLERYLDLTRQALAEGRAVDLLVSGLDADERAAAIERAGLGSPRLRVFRGFSRVAELIAYLSTAGEVWSSSTGPLHIAHAAGVPVMGIYPTKPRQETFARWRPDGYWHDAPVKFVEFDPSSV